MPSVYAKRTAELNAGQKCCSHFSTMNKGHYLCLFRSHWVKADSYMFSCCAWLREIEGGEWTDSNWGNICEDIKFDFPNICAPEVSLSSTNKRAGWLCTMPQAMVQPLRNVWEIIYRSFIKAQIVLNRAIAVYQYPADAEWTKNYNRGRFA